MKYKSIKAEKNISKVISIIVQKLKCINALQSKDTVQSLHGSVIYSKESQYNIQALKQKGYFKGNINVALLIRIILRNVLSLYCTQRQIVIITMF